MSTATDLVIRAGNANDFQAWFGLYEAVAAEGVWIAGEVPVDRAARKQSFAAHQRNPDSVTFMAEADGRLVGTLGVEVRGGIADLGMMVDSEWRGRGVGSALMEACVAFAREHGAHKLILEVWPHNQAAIGLYRKFGFEQEGLFRRHYRRGNGELWDAIRMGLVLDLESPGRPH